MSNYVLSGDDYVPVINAVLAVEDAQKGTLVQTPVTINSEGALAGNSYVVTLITTSTYTLNESNVGQMLYFTFAGAVTVTLATAATLDVGNQWMWAAGPSTTLTFSKQTGGDTLLGATTGAVTESGTIILRASSTFENDPRFQTAGPGAGTVTNVSSANADLSVATQTTTPVITLVSVGGATASNVALATAAANAATSANTVSTIVARDGSGNFAGGTITAATGLVATTGNVTASAGAVIAATTMTATLGAITATNGNLVLGTAGNKLMYSSVASTTTAGANSAGTVTLVGGTATISTTAVTASSLIRLTRQSVGATGAAALGFLSVGTISAGVSFIINAVQVAGATSLQASDVSVVFWEIVN